MECSHWRQRCLPCRAALSFRRRRDGARDELPRCIRPHGTPDPVCTSRKDSHTPQAPPVPSLELRAVRRSRMPCEMPSVTPCGYILHLSETDCPIWLAARSISCWAAGGCLSSCCAGFSWASLASHSARRSSAPRSRLQAARQHKGQRPLAMFPEQLSCAIPVQRTRRQKLRQFAILASLAPVADPAQPTKVIQGERTQHSRWA